MVLPERHSACRRREPQLGTCMERANLRLDCRSAEEARELWRALADRLATCKLVLHPEKTKIVYCKDANGVANKSVGSEGCESSHHQLPGLGG